MPSSRSSPHLVALLALCTALHAWAADPAGTPGASPWAELADMHERDQKGQRCTSR